MSIMHGNCAEDGSLVRGFFYIIIPALSWAARLQHSCRAMLCLALNFSSPFESAGQRDDETRGKGDLKVKGVMSNMISASAQMNISTELVKAFNNLMDAYKNSFFKCHGGSNDANDKKASVTVLKRAITSFNNAYADLQNKALKDLEKRSISVSDI